MTLVCHHCSFRRIKSKETPNSIDIICDTDECNQKLMTFDPDSGDVSFAIDEEFFHRLTHSSLWERINPKFVEHEEEEHQKTVAEQKAEFEEQAKKRKEMEEIRKAAEVAALETRTSVMALEREHTLSDRESKRRVRMDGARREAAKSTVRVTEYDEFKPSLYKTTDFSRPKFIKVNLSQRGGDGIVDKVQRLLQGEIDKVWQEAKARGNDRTDDHAVRVLDININDTSDVLLVDVEICVGENVNPGAGFNDRQTLRVSF